MHEIQRVFYFHLGSWMAMFTALSLAFVANVGWLVTRKPHWDWLGVASVEVGVVSCTAGLITGSSLGSPGMGHLVDVGRAPDDRVHSLDPLHLVPAAARID